MCLEDVNVLVFILKWIKDYNVVDGDKVERFVLSDKNRCNYILNVYWNF